MTIRVIATSTARIATPTGVIHTVISAVTEMMVQPLLLLLLVAEAEPGDRGVGVARLARVHPLPDPPPGPQVRPVRTRGL